MPTLECALKRILQQAGESNLEANHVALPNLWSVAQKGGVRWVMGLWKTAAVRAHRASDVDVGVGVCGCGYVWVCVYVCDGV